MMNAIKHMDKLVESGFTQQQAKVSVDTMVEMMNEKFVSKEYMKDVVHKMDKEFSSIKHEIREMEARIVIRLGKIVAASTAVAVGLTSLIQKIT